ncbi:MAG: hypothetical protein DMG65_23435 [Candidatus Angelobacter sp. Gp1-AA117]|nr:MAG: hypothetical protein DMG65_23435 [Candidatus Angelobacter sp. Gp1-AA117]
MPIPTNSRAEPFFVRLVSDRGSLIAQVNKDLQAEWQDLDLLQGKIKGRPIDELITTWVSW